MEPSRTWKNADYKMAAAIMALMGAYYWAIRGTGGYGGETGGMLAGFGWALLWYAFAQHAGAPERRPYASPWVIVAITFGIAFGGLTGYGVYISWLNGNFHLNYPEGLREVGAWTGYAMLFFCGLHWGGNAGALLAWCAPVRSLTAKDWTLRIASGAGGALAAYLFVRAFPQLFLPFYAEGIYNVSEYKTCTRALESIRTIAPHVGSFLGFLAYEIARRDRRAVAIMLTIALGFAIPFTLGGYWQTLHESSLKLEWWKNWEMTIGFGGGLSFGLAFWAFNRPGNTPNPALGPKSAAFFRSGFPLWLPTFVVLQGLYDGRCGMRGIEPPKAGYLLLALISAIPFIVAWILRRRNAGAAAAPYRVTLPAIAAFQLLILIAGALVSIPKEWRLSNTVLVSMYVGYIGISLILFALLASRRSS